MLYEEITRNIIGCAMKVHTKLGPGFQEMIYQRALEIELRNINMEYSTEHNMTIHYSGLNIGVRRVDFLVGPIMVELKATTKLDDLNLNQLLSYLKAYQLPIGLLINFGMKSLEFKRVYNPNHHLNKK